MAKAMTNYIEFEKSDILNSKGKGRISTLDRDIDIEVVPFTSDNDKAPSHQVYGKSPTGYQVQIGGIWEKENAEGGKYYTISIKEMGYNANLGRFPGQDDLSIQAIIPWNS